MKNDKDIQKYSKDELIQAVADDSSVNILMVKIIINALENVIIKKLKETNADKDVSIKLFNGFYVDSTYIPEKRKRNNLTGKLIDVSSKIKVKPKVTRRYMDKIN